MPRKSRLTPELRDKIAELVRGGNFLEPAARACGVRHSTLYLWLKLGSEGRKPYVDFVDVLEKAEAEAEVQVVTQLHQVIPTTWQAGFRWLESRAGLRWRRREAAAPLQLTVSPLASYEPPGPADSLASFLRKHPHRIPPVMSALRAIEAEVSAERDSARDAAHDGGAGID